MTDLSFIIVNWNTRHLLIDCINSIYSTVRKLNYLIYVVDNGSRDDSVKAVREHFPGVIIIENQENRGFAAAVNQALKKIDTRYAILLNTDTILHEDAINLLYSFMEGHKEAGIVGAQLQKLDGTKQHSYDNYPTLAIEVFNKSLLRILFPHRYPSKRQTVTQPIEVESVIGACLMIRNEAVKQVGMLDEDYFFFFEETDWCYRMQKAGWKVYHIPDAKVTHLGGQSKKMAPWQSQIEYCRSLYTFFRKNQSPLSYILFRIFYLIKIVLNFISNLIVNVSVFFQHQKIRYRLLIYFKLLWWHLLLCPEWMGLKPRPISRKYKVKSEM